MDTGLDEDIIARVEYEIAVLIRRATAADKARKIPVTLDRSAYLLLRRIAEGGAQGVKALADEFHLDISTLSRQAAAMEEKGHLRRVPDPTDKRASSFEITPLGETQLEQTRLARLALHRELLAGWSAEDGRKFGDMLHRLNRTFLD